MLVVSLAALLCGAEPVDLSEDLDRIRAQHDVSAMVCAAYVDGELVGTGAAGWYSYEDTTPVTLESRFHIGSCTKAMTGVMIGMLVEEGTIDWETSVAEALLGVTDQAHKHWKTVTVRDLLAHRSGVDEKRSQEIFFLPWSLQNQESPPDPRAQREAIAKAVLEGEPQLTGEVGELAPFEYSNFGYILAGAVLEAHYDRPWEELAREKIFEPLGMDSAGFGAPGTPGEWTEPVGHRRADEWTPVRPMPGQPEPDNPPAYGPAGRVHASILDWAKFVSDFDRGLDGEGQLLKAETYRVIAEDPDGDGYALGWGRSERDWAGGMTLSHAGSNTYWYAVTWLAPERDLAMVVATNVPPDPGGQASDQAIGLMVERFAGLSGEAEKSRELDENPPGE